MTVKKCSNSSSILSIVTVMVTVIIILVITAGCIAPAEVKPRKPKINLETGSYSDRNRLASNSDKTGSDENGPYVEIDASFEIKLNVTEIMNLKFELKFEDYDDEYKDTDENSPPDELEVEIKSGGYSTKKSGITPFTVTYEPTANRTLKEGEFLPTEWEVFVKGKCYSEQTYPKTARPSLFILFIPDSGIAYDLMVTFEYKITGERKEG